MLQWLKKLFHRRLTDSVLRSKNDHCGEFVYELPYEPGRRFWVIQGYGGTYSHFDESYFSIDFGMPEKTPICAARSGIVYHVITHFSKGGTHPSFKDAANAIHILHNDDTIAAYVHLMLNGTCLQAGDFIDVGQVIGFTGNTGYSGGPHLHFHVEDALDHQRMATLFNTVESGPATLEVGKHYQRRASNGHQLLRPKEQVSTGKLPLECHKRDAFAFYPELLVLCRQLVSELSMAGLELMADYESVNALHDVHGIEVCGIRNPDSALEITRFILRRFPGWNAGWLHPPDNDSSPDAWIASIQRDIDIVAEHWDTD